jgi:4-hydroxybenzoate polyprenyltransferase
VKKFFGIALIFSAITFIFSFIVSLWCFILVGASALFVTFHNKYLKKIVKIPAYSEIFTPIQWIVVVIFGFIAIWTTFPQNGDLLITIPLFGSISIVTLDLKNMIILCIFTYFLVNAHDLAEGIHDVDGDRKNKVSTYSTSFGEKTAAKISFFMFFISGILGIILYIYTILSPAFLLAFLIIWLYYTIGYSSKLIKSDNENLYEIGKLVGRKKFDFFLLVYNFIFIDLLIQLIFYHNF